VRAAQGSAVKYRDADGTPVGIVRKHGRGRSVYLNMLLTDYHRWRLKPPEDEPARRLIGFILQHAGAGVQYRFLDKDGAMMVSGLPGVEIHPWRCGDLRVLGIHRNYQLRVSELGPPEYRKQDSLAKPMKLKLDLGRAHAVYDQRSGKYFGKRRNVAVELPKYEPVVLAILPEPVEGLSISAPAEAKRGELVTARLKLRAPKLGDTHAFRVHVIGPDGKEMRMLTQTLTAPRGAATWEVPIAVSDPAGGYRLQARDIATGAAAEATLTVE
jgi:hypothetical protein